ncbi:MAG: thioesterase family protein [Polyangiales bacterium]
MGLIDEDTRLELVREHVFRAQVSERWNVGPIPNGGYLLAIATRAMNELVPDRELLTMTAHYLRPAKNAPVEVQVELVKIGRRFATLEAKMLQEGEHARVLATFATPGESAPKVLSAPPLVLPKIEDCVKASPLPGVTIGERFDVRFTQETSGFLEGKRTGVARIEAWVRFADGREPDAFTLPLIADGLPPPILNVVPFRWVPTLELTVHVRARPVPGWLRVKFETRFAFGGQLEVDGEIWDSTDTLVAQSRQLMLVPTP